ncbi:MAG: prepilin-type N-terminal cleavage/methylation domain-containing protein [Verrucomicrobiaceae bacterium]|nr:MAG: prepilin-type N-terminal cleavage/methylation domain-containing protein [Verrucomicrobiaceae bacterium]
MISAARIRNDLKRGFTLIEIVLVLGLAALIAGGAVTYMVFSADERVLRNTSGEIELMAKRARTLAMLQQTSYALEFRKEGVRLLPLAEAGGIERRTGLGNEIGGREVEEADPDKITPVRDEFPLPDDMEVSILRWNTTAWIPLVRDVVQIWRFDPDGLCEPVSVRYVIEKGVAESTFHPLTATVSDFMLEAR